MGVRRPLCLLLALACLGAAAATARADNGLPASLALEQLGGTPAIHGACDPDGSSQIGFSASGTATGPYPGTYSISGTATVGPQHLAAVIGNPADVGGLMGTTTSWYATFTIVSGDLTIEGTLSLKDGSQGGVCRTFMRKSDGHGPDVPGTYYRAEGGLSYRALIHAPGHTFLDTGFATAAPNVGAEMLDGSRGSAGFTLTFKSSDLGAKYLWAPGAPLDPSSAKAVGQLATTYARAGKAMNALNGPDAPQAKLLADARKLLALLKSTPRAQLQKAADKGKNRKLSSAGDDGVGQFITAASAILQQSNQLGNLLGVSSDTWERARNSATGTLLEGLGHSTSLPSVDQATPLTRGLDSWISAEGDAGAAAKATQKAVLDAQGLFLGLGGGFASGYTMIVRDAGAAYQAQQRALDTSVQTMQLQHQINSSIISNFRQ